MIFENTEAPHYGRAAYLGTVTEADLRSRAMFHFTSLRDWRFPSKAAVRAYDARPKPATMEEWHAMEAAMTSIPDIPMTLSSSSFKTFAWCDVCRELSSGIVSRYPDNDEPPVRMCYSCHGACKPQEARG